MIDEEKLKQIYNIAAKWNRYQISNTEFLNTVKALVNHQPTKSESWPPPKAEDRQVYLHRFFRGWVKEWCVQYGPADCDRYADGYDEAGALAQWHRIHVLGERW
jgi:hypothetical protein